MKRKEIVKNIKGLIENVLGTEISDRSLTSNLETEVFKDYNKFGIFILRIEEFFAEFNILITSQEQELLITGIDFINYLSKELPEPIKESKYIPKTFFTSDLHLNHKNLVMKISEWEDCTSCRDFETVEEMNETIFRNINETVGEDDILLILGDFAITNPRNWKMLRDQIKCKNIHLVYGNHDPISDLEGNKEFKYNPFDINGNILSPVFFKIADLFSSVQHVKDIKVQIPGTNEHQRIFLSHYSHRTWEAAHHGKWMLYGHSHGSLAEYASHYNDMGATVTMKYRTMDVGVDTHPNFRPYSFEELFKILNCGDRVNLGVDHHRAEK